MSRPAMSRPRIAQTPMNDRSISATPMCMPVWISTRLAARQSAPIAMSLIEREPAVARRMSSTMRSRNWIAVASAPTRTAAMNGQIGISMRPVVPR